MGNMRGKLFCVKKFPPHPLQKTPYLARRQLPLTAEAIGGSGYTGQEVYGEGEGHPTASTP